MALIAGLVPRPEYTFAVWLGYTRDCGLFFLSFSIFLLYRDRCLEKSHVRDSWDGEP